MVSASDWTEGLESYPIFSSIKEIILVRKNSKYIKHNIPGPGVSLNDFETSLKGCDCLKTCSEGCCSCIDQFGSSYTCDRRISSQYLHGENMKPTFECNNNCKCALACCNRIAQHGVESTCRLEIFVTENKGLGLRTLAVIPQGQFVCEYAGEIISYEEAKKRTANLKNDDMNYILTVNEHCKSSVIRTYVDPTVYGNIGRYINHSCAPNLTMIPVRVHNTIPLISLFAKKDVAPMEELTFNYGSLDGTCTSTLDHSNIHVQTEEITKTLKPCNCKSENCSGFLPYDKSLFDC